MLRYLQEIKDSTPCIWLRTFQHRNTILFILINFLLRLSSQYHTHSSWSCSRSCLVMEQSMASDHRSCLNLLEGISNQDKDRWGTATHVTTKQKRIRCFSFRSWTLCAAKNAHIWSIFHISFNIEKPSHHNQGLAWHLMSFLLSCKSSGSSFQCNENTILIGLGSLTCTFCGLVLCGRPCVLFVCAYYIAARILCFTLCY